MHYFSFTYGFVLFGINFLLLFLAGKLIFRNIHKNIERGEKSVSSALIFATASVKMFFLFLGFVVGIRYYQLDVVWFLVGIFSCFFVIIVFSLRFKNSFTSN